jgi:hypothetical protein
MTVTAMILLGVLAAPPAPSQSQPTEPTLTAIFNTSEPDRGPAFLVECINSTGRRLSSGSDEWPLTERAIRIDGQVLSESGGGRIGPGLTTNVQPGQTWRGFIELFQKQQSHFKAVQFGALVRAPFLVPLEPGRHTIAVRCLERWSTDMVFFVEQ